MRVMGLLLLVAVVSGCCHSRYANDPRAAVVGPAYLDYIADHPRDCTTQYYYPSFHLGGDTNQALQPAAMQLSSRIQSLLIERPPESSRVESESGKGYPHLEAVGIRVFTQAAN